MWPRGSSPAFALWQDLNRALRGPRPSSWRLSISTLHRLLIPPGCMCVRGRGEERERSTDGRSPSGAHSGEGRESAKIACCVTWSQGCRCLMIASCLLYVWCVVCGERPSSEVKKGPFHVIVTFIAMVWDLTVYCILPRRLSRRNLESGIFSFFGFGHSDETPGGTPASPGKAHNSPSASHAKTHIYESTMTS